MFFRKRTFVFIGALIFVGAFFLASRDSVDHTSPASKDPVQAPLNHDSSSLFSPTSTPSHSERLDPPTTPRANIPPPSGARLKEISHLVARSLGFQNDPKTDARVLSRPNDPQAQGAWNLSPAINEGVYEGWISSISRGGPNQAVILEMDFYGDDGRNGVQARSFHGPSLTNEMADFPHFKTPIEIRKKYRGSFVLPFSSFWKDFAPACETILFVIDGWSSPKNQTYSDSFTARIYCLEGQENLQAFAVGAFCLQHLPCGPSSPK